MQIIQSLIHLISDLSHQIPSLSVKKYLNLDEVIN